MSFINSQDAKHYQNQIKCENVQTFEERYPHTSQGLINVLKSLLEFNPYFRPSAAEIIKSPIFDQIRVPALENLSPKEIHQQDFSEYFDYNSYKTVGISEDELHKALKDELMKEIRKVKKAKKN